MVRCHKIIEIIEEEKYVENAEKVGHYLLQELVRLEIKFPQLSNARGLPIPNQLN